MGRISLWWNGLLTFDWNVMSKAIATFDIDGVIFNGHGVPGIYPGPDDIIITGRSFEEEKETRTMLFDKGITNKVYFNPTPFEEKSREDSGKHKANTINRLIESGLDIYCHYEDDLVQVKEMKKHSDVYVIWVRNPRVGKRNRRQDEI